MFGNILSSLFKNTTFIPLSYNQIQCRFHSMFEMEILVHFTYLKVKQTHCLLFSHMMFQPMCIKAFAPLVKFDKKRSVYMSNYGGSGFGSGFALLVVLFILLVIIGCSCYGGGYGGC